MKTMTRNQPGFTLIELVMIIVILGILAAVAIPRFINPTDSAQQEAVQGFASSLTSANSINYSGCSALGNVVKEGKCQAVTKCSDVAATIVPALTLGTAGDAIANTYNVLADSAVVGDGTEATCTLQYLKSGVTYTSTYVVTGAGQ